MIWMHTSIHAKAEFAQQSTSPLQAIASKVELVQPGVSWTVQQSPKLPPPPAPLELEELLELAAVLELDAWLELAAVLLELAVVELAAVVVLEVTPVAPPDPPGPAMLSLEAPPPPELIGAPPEPAMVPVDAPPVPAIPPPEPAMVPVDAPPLPVVGPTPVPVLVTCVGF